MSIATHEALAECVERNSTNFTERVKHAIHFKKFGFAFTIKTTRSNMPRVSHALNLIATSFYRFRFAPPVASDIGVCSAHFQGMFFLSIGFASLHQ